MKRILFLFVLLIFAFYTKADGPSDLVIVNPLSTPGAEVVVEDNLAIEFYDISGKRIQMEYTYDPVTGKITIKNATGLVFVVVTNKKTKESKTSKVFFTTGS